MIAYNTYAGENFIWKYNFCIIDIGIKKKPSVLHSSIRNIITDFLMDKFYDVIKWKKNCTSHCTALGYRYVAKFNRLIVLMPGLIFLLRALNSLLPIVPTNFPVYKDRPIAVMPPFFFIGQRINKKNGGIAAVCNYKAIIVI